jgi:hypothetical protein
MKNNLSLILIALLLITACSKKQSRLNDLQKNGLKGNVYKIKESTYGIEEKFGDVSKGKLLSSSISTYNDKGNIISEENIEVDNNTTKRDITSYGYNDKAQLISFSNTKNPTLKREYLYKDDLLSEENSFENGKLETKTKYVFNDGLLAEVNIYKADSTLDWREKYGHNSQGISDEVTYYNGDNQWLHKANSSYNKDGWLEKYHDEYKSYNVIFSQKYSDIDSKGNWLKVTSIDEKNKPSIMVERKIEYK